LLKVRDHCHMSGKYRGAAHSDCNLKLKINSKEPWKNKIPVIFHNLRGFDGHLIMQALGKSKAVNLSCIPNNMEKYMSFTVGQFVFMDSLQHLAASLETLVDGLQEDQFKITREYFKNPEQFALMRQKGVYPYDYMDSLEKFEETKLPPTESFHNEIRKEGITDKDYAHAQKVWSEFNLKNMGEYHDLYLRSDVLLLADVWTAYCEKSIDVFGLDPTNYITLPGMAMDAMLRMTKAEPDTLQDLEMYNFCELGIRGGICTTGSKRYAKANNPKCPNHDPSKPTTWIVYFDAVNLYGRSLCLKMPYSDFEWKPAEDMDIGKILNVSEDSDIDYFVECDLTIPEELHDHFNAYPPVPESKIITEEMLSDYQRNLLGKKKTPKVKKLIPDLNNKEKYIIHGKLLRLYVQLGVCVAKIHRVLQFKQKSWIQPYVDYITEKRKNAKSEFESLFYKLAINAIYGKTMENVRKRQLVDLVNSRAEADKFRKLVADPAFIKDKEFDNGLFAIHSKKTKITLNKPIYVGMAVLDLSKYIMYDFYYNHIKRRYGDKVELLYTDTDSLVLLIETEDVYEDMWEDQNLYDTSNFPEDFRTSKGHQLYSTKNKKVAGKFKDECGVKNSDGAPYYSPISEFVSLRPKMYSYVKADGKEDRRVKGISRPVVKHDIRHEMFMSCLLDGVEKKHEQMQIRSDHHHLGRSDHHHLGLYKSSKVSLSPNDTKRYICADGITTLAYGHYRINSQQSVHGDQDLSTTATVTRMLQSLVTRIWHNLQLLTNK